MTVVVHRYFFTKMPLKSCKTLPNRSNNKNKRNISSTEKTISTNMPKKVLISKKWHSNCSHEVKTRSAGLIECKKQREKPNKASSSLPAVSEYSEVKDFCRTCGDTDDIETAVSVFNTVGSSNSKTSASTKSKKGLQSDPCPVEVETEVVKEYYKNEKFADSKSTIDHFKKSNKTIKINSNNYKGIRNDKNKDKHEEVVQEHYLNENFADLYDSMHDFDNLIRGGQTLDTITEVNEKQASTESKAPLSGRSTLESNVCIVEHSDDELSLKRLKEFRDKNYFECHSAKKRIESQGSVISLRDHKCTYRLYLNDRLFPVAIDDDHNDSIRCVDCHLPLELACDEDKTNGTIQAKVKLGSETQDMVLLLPIKEPLIIKQKIKEQKDDDVVYFGLVKLDCNGDSMFNRSLPSDSLALRYQKGYRQFNDIQRYRYDRIEESDVIYV